VHKIDLAAQAEAIRQTGDLFRKTQLTPAVRKFLNFMRKLTP